MEEKRGEKGVDTINSLVSNFILMINFSFPTCKSLQKWLASVQLGNSVLGTATVLVPTGEHFSLS